MITLVVVVIAAIEVILTFMVIRTLCKDDVPAPARKTLATPPASVKADPFVTSGAMTARASGGVGVRSVDGRV
jgi:hypothetical protein